MPTVAPSGRSSRAWSRGRGVALVLVILSLAAVARGATLGWGLPRAYHPDEWFYAWNAASILERGDLRLRNVRGYVNPTAFVYATTLGCAALDAADVGGWPGGRGTLDRYRARRGHWHLVARTLSALAGVVAVALVYRTGRALEVLGAARPGAGALAAALLAASPLHVRDSHFGTSDVPVSAAVAWCVLALVRYAGAPSVRRAALAGLALGTACATKYNAGLLAVPLGLVLGPDLVGGLVARLRGALPALAPDGRAAIGRVVIAGAAAALAFLILCPAPAIDLARFASSFGMQAKLATTPYEGQDPIPSWLFHARTLALALGPVGLVLAVLGLARLARSRPGLAVAAFPAAHLAVFLPMPFAFARVDIPALPPLAVAAGVVAAEAIARARRGRFGTLVGPLLIFALLAPPAALSARIVRLLAAADTRATAETWLRERLGERPVLGADPEAFRGVVPLGTDGMADRDLAGVFRVDLRGPPELDALAARGVRYVVLTSGEDDSTRASAPARAFMDALRARAELRLAVEAGAAGAHVPYASEERYGPFEHAFARARPGPPVRIFELPERAAPVPDVAAPPARAPPEDGR